MRHALVLIALGACSGDDSHRQTTTPKPAPPVVAQADAAPPPPVAPPPATGQGLSESMAQSYFTAGDAAEGAKQFALKKWPEAKAAFEAARKVTTDPTQGGRLDLMIGLCDEELSDWPDAAQHLVAAHKQLAVLADYIGYHAAHALYRAHQPGALDLAKSVARDSIDGANADILVGDLMADANDWKGVLAHYRDYLGRHPDGPYRSEARFRVAESLEHTGGDPIEIVKTYRSIEIDDPLSSWNTKAHDRLAELAKTLPATVARTIDKFSAAEHIARANVLYDNMRNPESEKAFDEALADPAITKADKCKAAYRRADSRFKARDRKGAAPMFDVAVAACKAAGNKDLEIKSNYQAGRSYSFYGEHKTAIERYKQVQTIDPKHSYADDGMLREAEEWAVLPGEGAKVEAVLAALPTKFPDGDNVAEAMWRLGWRMWRDNKYADAIKWWTKQIELVPHDDSWIGEGEPQYWIGRALNAEGKTAEAIAEWQTCVRTYPAAYYALLSLNRIREVDHKAYDALVAEIAADPAGFDPKAPAFTFAARPEWSTPGFERAIELLKLGLGEPAEHELKKLGLTPPGDRKRVDDADKIDKLWAIAFLYDRAGRYATSHWPTRWHILDYRRQWPVGANRARWEIAYPKAYWELLNRHADMNHTPIAMQIAIVREESAFDPLDESYANAIGLTQMIPVTAADFSKGTGIDPTRENLRDPEKNVTIGGRFLGYIYKKWNSFTVLVPPSYNAGPGAVTKMLRLRGTWDTDEFVEGIVDDQARNYTKRVLGSYFTYSWLYQHEVPVIPLKIPTALLPKK